MNKRLDKEQDRKFIVLLYVDTDDYDISNVLSIATGFKEYAYILHDRDLKEDGIPKKDHFHLAIRQDTPTTRSAIANKLGIDIKWVQYADKWPSSIRYLCHIDDDDKIPYAPTDIVSNFDVNKYIKYKDDIAMASVIFNHIVETKCTSTIELVKWCIDNACWSEFRRCFSIWNSVMNEVNIYNERN